MSNKTDHIKYDPPYISKLYSLKNYNFKERHGEMSKF